MFMTNYSLISNWKFTYAAYLYNKDHDPLIDDGRSISIYAKYMFYENESHVGERINPPEQISFGVRLVGSR